MTKLSTKFITGIISILIMATICSILLNTQFVERFYLYKKQSSITQMGKDFVKTLNEGETPQQAIDNFEKENKVIISEIDTDIDLDNDKLNQKIQEVFKENGIGFQKYWLWEGDYEKVAIGENKVRLYKQENLNYSLLINYIQNNENMYIITMIIPDVSDVFHISTQVLILVNISSILIAILMIFVLVKRITEPLHLFDTFANNMKKNQFIPIKVDSNDELEAVAHSFNDMGNKIIQAQESLQEKNTQMENLLDNVAHDLKTPISLIQLYAQGMKDEMDDGTFLNTIIDENKQMAVMVNRLLFLSKIERNKEDYEIIDLSSELAGLISKYTILAQDNQIMIRTDIDPHIQKMAVTEHIQSLFSNLITNAIKYSGGKYIEVTLKKSDEAIVLTTKNQTNNEQLNIDKIWTMYYVGEESRNKKLSGTGLGLSIVQKICETEGYIADCQLIENDITFSISMPI